MNEPRDFFSQSLVYRRLHITAIDPCAHEPDALAGVIDGAVAGGTDAFLVGGSDDVNGPLVGRCVEIVKKSLNGAGERTPVFLFPSSAATATVSGADGVLFLSLFNSRDVRFVVREQARAASFLAAHRVPAVGCAMILVEPGGTAGRVGQAELLDPTDVEGAASFALAARAFGFPLVYLNAGSGSPAPVRPAMIEYVSARAGGPLIVGGGLRDAEKVATAVRAGADIVITGTAIESCDNVAGIVAELAGAVHAAPPRGAA
ncbi:phosphoglycerol geranylgeranyltransferase [bacterium]|nr:phosphoglycerol geranylgeranyltransferase [bacterium]